jgi:hypothetical protein
MAAAANRIYAAPVAMDCFIALQHSDLYQLQTRGRGGSAAPVLLKFTTAPPITHLLSSATSLMATLPLTKVNDDGEPLLS